MSKKKIFIFEFLCGGGFNKVNIPSSLFSEGFGMLRSIVSDFKAQDFEIKTMLDYRAQFLSEFLQTDEISSFLPQNNQTQIHITVAVYQLFAYISFRYFTGRYI